MTTEQIITISGGIFIGALQAFNNWQQRKTAVTIDVIHKLTNSAMGESKRTLAEVTAAKAVITKLPSDIAAADDAMRNYLRHVAKQSQVDSPQSA